MKLRNVDRLIPETSPPTRRAGRRLAATPFATLLALALSLTAVACRTLEDGSSFEGPTTAPRSVRPVATYSVVARDGRTGRIGVAVQSHWFDVGGTVPWAEAGVGAVATQSLVDPAYGPLGLELMRGGKTPREALDALLTADEGAAVRQVAMIAATGEAAAHTGKGCIAHAGHVTKTLDDGTVASAQANIMRSEGVPEAMLAALDEHYSISLEKRLMRALHAAEAAGGDLRGKQSAALIVVAPQSTGRPWVDRLVDLSVHDHEEPLAELDRLLLMHEAYAHMNRGDAALEEGDLRMALREYTAAQSTQDLPEMAFWTAVTLVENDRTSQAMGFFEKAFRDEGGGWRELVQRLPAAGLFPDDPELMEKVLAIGE